MIEIDTKKETDILRQEIAALQQQLSQVQIRQNDLTSTALKKVGALEYLENLEKVTV